MIPYMKPFLKMFEHQGQFWKKEIESSWHPATHKQPYNYSIHKTDIDYDFFEMLQFSVAVQDRQPENRAK